MQTVFEAACGAWHHRVIADDVVGHAFSHGFHPRHVERLAAYWAEALGGPSTYSDTYGDETSVVKMHSGSGEHDEMDRPAIACFDQALADVGLADGGAPRQVLHATTSTLLLCLSLSIQQGSWTDFPGVRSTSDLPTGETGCRTLPARPRRGLHFWPEAASKASDELILVQAVLG